MVELLLPWCVCTCKCMDAVMTNILNVNIQIMSVHTYVKRCQISSKQSATIVFSSFKPLTHNGHWIIQPLTKVVLIILEYWSMQRELELLWYNRLWYREFSWFFFHNQNCQHLSRAKHSWGNSLSPILHSPTVLPFAVHHKFDLVMFSLLSQPN